MSVLILFSLIFPCSCPAIPAEAGWLHHNYNVTDYMVSLYDLIEKYKTRPFSLPFSRVLFKLSHAKMDRQRCGRNRQSELS